MILRKFQFSSDACFRRYGRSAITALAFAFAGSTIVNAAPTVSFVAVNLPDVVVGQDLWRYDYKVTGNLAEFESINLIFQASAYSGLSVVSSDRVWTMSVADSVPALPADGLVTATATAVLSALDEGLLSVEFNWAGSGNPGPQSFDWQDDSFNSLGTFQTQATGPVVPVPVPEPGTLILTLAAIGLLGRNHFIK